MQEKTKKGQIKLIKQGGINYERRKCGKHIESYDDGTLKSIGEYSYGFQCGDWENYYPNEQLKSKGPMDNSRRNGDWEFYNEDGTLHAKGLFDEMGRLNGLWYINGEYALFDHDKKLKTSKTPEPLQRMGDAIRIRGDKLKAEIHEEYDEVTIGLTYHSPSTHFYLCQFRLKLNEVFNVESGAITKDSTTFDALCDAVKDRKAELTYYGYRSYYAKRYNECEGGFEALQREIADKPGNTPIFRGI